MAPSAALVPVLLAALLAAPSAAGSNHTVFAVSRSGLMHLDSSGALLAWRPDTNQTGQVAANPQNGTVCWMRRQRDPELGGIIRFSVRCAELSRLNQTWDLPLPLTLNIGKVSAFAFDWVTQNWYLTVGERLHLLRKDGALHFDAYSSYVCSYLFDKCHQLAENVSSDYGNFFAAYDISNRLVSFIAVEGFFHRLRLMQLDGSGVHDLETYIREPFGLALDPVGRHIYWLDPPFPKGNAIDLNRIDYDGQNMRRVKRVNDYRNIKAIDAVGGTVVLLRNNRSTISVVDVATGEMTDLVAGAMKGGESIPALAKVEDLLAVNIVSHDTQLEAENLCSSTGGDCQDFCIPTMANNTAATTCVCPEGLQLVDLECRKEHPSFALMVGAVSLQAVDLQTEEVTTILSKLTDGTKVDVYRVADAEFLLFWLDAGSLFRGRWSPGGSVTDVRLLVPATETERVVEVAVYAGQHQLFWMKKDDADASAGSSVVVQMSPLNGSYVKTVFMSNWKDQQDQVTDGGSAFFLIGSQFARQRGYWVTLPAFSTPTCSNSTLDVEDLAGIVMDEPLSQSSLLYRTFWIDRATQSIEYIYTPGVTFSAIYSWNAGRGRSRLLTHPSLADAGGLDVTDSRLFWTERSSGRLWTADSETGGGVRSLPGVTAGRSLRLIQPWRRPTIAPVCDENRAGCSHFCRRFIQGFTDTPVEAKCDCPDGMQLGDDRKTCQEAAMNATGKSDKPLGCRA